MWYIEHKTISKLPRMLFKLSMHIQQWHTFWITESIFVYILWANTVECRYNTAQYNMTLHTSLRWLGQGINHSLNPQNLWGFGENWSLHNGMALYMINPYIKFYVGSPCMYLVKQYNHVRGHTTSYLTHITLDNIAAISQTTFSNAFSSMKMGEFRFKFYWNLLLRVQLIKRQHRFR